MALPEQERAARAAAADFYSVRQKEWRKCFEWWWAAYYILSFALVICSATAASSKQLGFSDWWSSILSVLVVILTGSLVLAKPDDRGSRYRQAWSLLNVQLSRFLFDGTYTLNHVIRAYEQGEAIIHQAPAVQQTPQAPATPQQPPPGNA
jgi:hypothetical protein